MMSPLSWGKEGPHRSIAAECHTAPTVGEAADRLAWSPVVRRVGAAAHAGAADQGKF